MARWEPKPCRGCGEFKDKGQGQSYCPECKAQQGNRWQPAYAARRRAARYGLTVDELNELLALGACEVCGADDIQLCIDHDHETGKVRGLLCDLCNKALGQARDDADILRGLADYIEERG